MSPQPVSGTLTVPVSIKPAAQCVAGWPVLFRMAGWRVFARRCSEPGARRIDMLVKHHEHVFAFQQFDDVCCAQQLRLPLSEARFLLALLALAGLVQR